MTKVNAIPSLFDADTDEQELVNALAGLDVSFSALGAPALPARSLLDRLKREVESARLRYAPFFARSAKLFGVSETEIEAQFAELDDPAVWKDSGAPGIRQFDVRAGAELKAARCVLLRCEPGAMLPFHRHLGAECVLVLEGGYIDDSGNEYVAGEWHQMSAGTEHALRVQPDEGCTIASVAWGVEFLRAKRP